MVARGQWPRPARVAGVLALVGCFGGCAPAQLPGGTRVRPPASQVASRTAVLAPPPSLDVLIPTGTTLRPLVEGLSYLVDVTFAPDGTMYLASAGDPAPAGDRAEAGAAPPRLWRIGRGGERRELKLPLVPLELVRAHPMSTLMPEGVIPPLTGVTYHKGLLYLAHRSRISTLDPRSGAFKTVINGLPSWGESLNHKVIFDGEGKLYFVVSTQSSAGVIEPEWLSLMQLFDKPQAHEVPCEDITLSGKNYGVPGGPQEGLTGAYVPLSTTTESGQLVFGQLPCNGAMLQAEADGTKLAVVAWGLHSSPGYRFSPKGRLFATHAAVAPRAPRPIHNDTETLYEILPGRWYGWPDYFSGVPVTDDRFGSAEDPACTAGACAREFVLSEETRQRLLGGAPLPPQPLLAFAAQAGAQGLLFGRRDWGMDPEHEVLVAEMGSLEGRPRSARTGFRIVRIDLRTKQTSNFVVNRSGGPASLASQPGIERPVQLEWGPDGALYIVDFGRITVSAQGTRAHPGTATLWRLKHLDSAPGWVAMPAPAAPH